MKRLGNALMASPSLEYVDATASLPRAVELRERARQGGHIAAPLTLGSTRQAGLELDKTFATASRGRLHGGYWIVSRENPGYDIRDLRSQFWAEGSRRFARVLNASTWAGWADVSFGDVHDQLVTGGASISLDTRVNPAFPRNAVVRQRRMGGAVA